MASRVKTVASRMRAALIRALDGEPIFYRVFAALWLVLVIFAAYNLAAGGRFVMLMFGTLAVIAVVPAIIWYAIPLWGVLRGLRALRRRDIRSACRNFAVPMTGALVLLFGDGVFQWTRFTIERPQYQAAVTRMEQEADEQMPGKATVSERDTVRQAPILAVFPWEGWGGFWFGIIYDSTDQITKPYDARSDDWKSHPSADALACTGAIRSFGGHYYFVGGVDC